MSHWRTIAMNAYYYGSLPTRPLLRHWLGRRGTAPLGVLFYHRIADNHPNDWTMSNDGFRQQMMWLKQHVDLVSLDELQQRLRSGKNDRVAIAITFDDGYAENCDQAIPLLVDQEIPATYFVALDFIVNGKAFPHDVKHGQPLAANTPHQIREMAAAGISIGAHTRTHCDVGAIDDAASMRDEIVSARNELEDLAGTSVTHFAFPYGMPANLSRAAEWLCRQEGLHGVCSAFGAYNHPGQDPFHIRRFHADPEFTRFLNWTTVDARKLSHYRDFQIPESALPLNALQEAECSMANT
ncbi:MAG: polysaccharide deacetylase family protein [Planctomycetota bacterium]